MAGPYFSVYVDASSYAFHQLNFDLKCKLFVENWDRTLELLCPRKFNFSFTTSLSR